MEVADEEHGLRRALGPLNLVALGIGVIIGAGIFVLTGLASAFAGLCYAWRIRLFRNLWHCAGRRGGLLRLYWL